MFITIDNEVLQPLSYADIVSIVDPLAMRYGVHITQPFKLYFQKLDEVYQEKYIDEGLPYRMMLPLMQRDALCKVGEYYASRIKLREVHIRTKEEAI